MPRAPQPSSLFVGPIKPRSEIPEACQPQWDRLGRPGTWWTGAERLAIARQARLARDCELCAQRLAALTPSAVPHSHAAVDGLSAPAVDAVHRIVSDPARLSSTWLRETLAAGVEDTRLVEIIGVIATVTVIDGFARGIGARRTELPPATPGEPTRERPAGTAVSSALLPTVDPARAEGEMADYYAGMPLVDGRPPHVLRALTLVPAEQVGFRSMAAALYVGGALFDHEFDRSITRAQMEFLATSVSAANECFY